MSRRQLWSRLSQSFTCSCPSSHLSRHPRLLSQPPFRLSSLSSICSPRHFSQRFAADVEHVAVPCASSGDITLSLHNLSRYSPTAPLLLYLPPFPDADPSYPSPLPPFLLDQSICPVVSIHYRWATSLPDSDDPPLLWPTPLHDVLFAHDWLRQRFAKRLLFAYGSRLSASLVATLALTETISPLENYGDTESNNFPRTGMRGFAALDGIYNWTAFLQGDRESHSLIVHPIAGIPSPTELFSRPTDLLDSFASPSLFFRMLGKLYVPQKWEEDEEAVDTEDDAAMRVIRLFRPPRTTLTHHWYPPPKSSVILPVTLLLHDVGESGIRTSEIQDTDKDAPKPRYYNNSYAMQAVELASLMRNSLRDEMLRGRTMRYSDYLTGENKQVLAAETGRYVRLMDVDNREDAEDALLEWLEEMVD